MLEQIKLLKEYKYLSTRAKTALESIFYSSDMKIETLTYARICKFRNVGNKTGQEIFSFLSPIIRERNNGVIYPEKKCSFCGNAFIPIPKNRVRCSVMCDRFSGIKSQLLSLCKKYDKKPIFFIKRINGDTNK